MITIDQVAVPVVEIEAAMVTIESHIDAEADVDELKAIVAASPLPPNVRKLTLTPFMQQRMGAVMRDYIMMPAGASRRIRRAVEAKNAAVQRRAKALLQAFIAQLERA